MRECRLSDCGVSNPRSAKRARLGSSLGKVLLIRNGTELPLLELNAEAGLHFVVGLSAMNTIRNSLEASVRKRLEEGHQVTRWQRFSLNALAASGHLRKLDFKGMRFQLKGVARALLGREPGRRNHRHVR